MDFTDLLSELTKPLLPTKAMVISFLVFLSLCIVAIVAEKLNFTNVAGVCAGLSIAMAVVTGITRCLAHLLQLVIHRYRS